MNQESIRARITRVRRWLLKPFQKLEKKIKRSAEKFIVKAVEKHSGGVVSSVSNDSAAPLQSQLISLIRAGRRTESPRPNSMVGIPVGNQFLTNHPRAGFVYCSANDLVSLPHRLSGDYQPNVTAWLCANTQEDDQFFLIGGRDGYHAITVLSQLGHRGKLILVCDELDDLTTLNLNLHSHRFESNASVERIDMNDFANLRRLLVDATQRHVKLKILVDCPTALTERIESIVRECAADGYAITEDGSIARCECTKAESRDQNRLDRKAA